MTIEPVQSMHGRLLRQLREHGSAIVSFCLFAFGIFAVYRLLVTVDIHLVLHELSQIPKATLLIAVILTLVGYVALTGYDWSALRYLKKTIPTPILVVGSFTAYALSNTVGLAVLSGGAVRHRFYRGLGLDTADIAVIASFCALSFGMGVTLIGLAALAYHPLALSNVFSASAFAVRSFALITVFLIVSLALWSSLSQHAIKLGRYSIGLPEPSILGAQLLCALLDIGLSGFVLYLLMPATVDMPFTTFIAVFSAAVVVGVMSHVPGGIGVFESIVIGAVVQSEGSVPGVTAALLAYRAIYYFLPFLLSLLLLTASGPLLRSKFMVSRTLHYDLLTTVLEFLNPALLIGLSALVFMAGSMLLLNGVVPFPNEVMMELAPAVKFSAFEFSNVLLGVEGAALIILSYGLRRRIKGAFFIVQSLLLIGFVALLVIRADLKLLLFMCFVSTLLFASRKQFYRSSKLTSQVLSLEWILLCGSLLITALLLLLYTHDQQGVGYQLWWQFALDSNLSRSLRIYGACLIAGFLILLGLSLRPARRALMQVEAFDEHQVAGIVGTQNDPDANFVYTGDKHLLFSERSDAFVMYAPQSKSLIALGDPIGNPESKLEMINAFVELANQHKHKPCFYHIGPELLENYIDSGFSISKLGEQAIVELNSNTLDEAVNNKPMAAYEQGLHLGLEFTIFQPPFNKELIQELRRVSDDWLMQNQASEKNFLLGHFDDAYLQRFPLAVVSLEGRLMAFANVLVTDTRACATLDLLRSTTDAPESCRHFLTISLMKQLQKEGCQSFSLGMVPMELSASANKRMWNHVGLVISRFGSSHPDLEDMRAYKEAFDPQWRPRYIATWSGVNPQQLAGDINALIADGLIGAVYRPK